MPLSLKTWSVVTPAFLVMALVLSLHTMPYRGYAMNAAADGSPEQLARGVAALPFQYRSLVPTMARLLTSDRAASAASLKTRYWWLEFLALVSLGVAYRRYLAYFIRERAVSSVLALSLYAILPFNYRDQPFYPYDTPSILFFTVGLILILERKWLLIYPLFVFATLNRETSIFLAAMTGLIGFTRPTLGRTAAHVLAQCCLWIVIKWGLFEMYRNSPVLGFGMFQLQLGMNVALVLRNPWLASTALSTWGFLWIPVLVWQQRIPHPALRLSLWIVPVFVASMMVVGVMTERRIYGELVPVVLTGALVIFVDLMKGSLTATPDLLRHDSET